MPISLSAKKALRVNQRQTAINHHRKRLIKAAIKNVSDESLTQAISLIDKAVKWQIFHANKAARLKSQLMKKYTAPASAAKPKKTVAKAKPAVKVATPKVVAKKSPKTTTKKPAVKKATAKTTKK
jgi:ribosomal protein S20